MHISSFLRRRCRWLLIACSLLFIGCDERVERLDRREERDAYILRGDARKRAGDVDGAIEQYLKALERRPNLATAHLKLGLEYKDAKQDYLRAIYHLQRYMEMRPEGRKNELLEQLVRRAHVQYLASMPNPPPGALREIALLERENARLRAQVEELAQRLQEMTQAAAARPTPPAIPSATRAPEVTPPRASTPSRPAQAARTYRVQRGDTLSRIAATEYGDSTRWREIFNANRGVLATPDSLREGQELVIP